MKAGVEPGFGEEVKLNLAKKSNLLFLLVNPWVEEIEWSIQKSTNIGGFSIIVVGLKFFFDLW